MAVVTRLFRRSPRLVPPGPGYALWAETYPARAHNAVMRAEQRVMAPMIAACSPRRAIDVGTGTGRYLPIIQAAGARLVVGLDLSLEMLSRQDPGRLRVRADACRLPFRAGAFDLVTSSLMLGDVEDLAAWGREAARLLAPGGHLVFSDFHPAWAELGWQRTFTAANGRTYRIPYHPHRIASHVDVLESHALDVIAVREPRLDEADAARLGDRHPNVPVVVVFYAVRRRAATTNLGPLR